jgi:aminoglycoside/choline kinase family phosphotransferase
MSNDHEAARRGAAPHPANADPAFAWAEARLARRGGAEAVTWSALPAQASHRRFYRATFPPSAAGEPAVAPGSAILMASPPALEQNTQFARLAPLFRQAGIGVPQIHAFAEEEGWFLLEDLGDRHLDEVYATPARNTALDSALETLHALQAVRDPAVPPYTAARFRDELVIFTEWFVEGFLAAAPEVGITADAFGLLVGATQSQVQCCVHRDYHCRNLLLRSDGRIGVVDFQDALMGPAAYDLASLLRDCYYVFSEAEVARWRDRYLARTGLPLDPAVFPRDLDLTAVQRQLKAIGIFARLWLRDDKRTHLQWIEPVLARVIALAAAYAELAPLAAWLRKLQPAAANRLAGIG